MNNITTYPRSFESKIGFVEVRSILKSYCTGTLGKEKVDAMQAISNFKLLQRRLSEVDEILKAIQSGEVLPSIVESDTRDALKRIRPQGTYLLEEELWVILCSMLCVDEIIRFVRAHNPEDKEASMPALKEHFNDCIAWPKLCKRIASIFNQQKKIADNASKELASIRSEMSSLERQMTRLVNKAMVKAKSDGYMEADAMPAVRDGRIVLPINPSYKRSIQGIVQGESTTGRTIFIEPAEVVEAGNRLRELEAEEKREIIRILTMLTDEIRPFSHEIIEGIGYIAEFDFIIAKAKFANKFEGSMPKLHHYPFLDWVDAVHPILAKSLHEHDKEVVPLNIKLERNNSRILIISGPNAGGKSVCLKTVGIIQYMMQCGMLPCLSGDSQMGIFRTLTIDIGDEQSIEDDLSTYSSHLRNMKEFVKLASKDMLLLIDEFGGGTEPRIGGAIAQALLGEFNEAGCWGVITTHYHNLKLYADDTKGLMNAAMLYDRHLMKPLFSLAIGRPGSSFAIEIARKTGLPERVISQASEIVGQDYTDMDKYLQDIIRDKRYWEQKRNQVRIEEKKLQETSDSYSKRLAELQSERKKLMKEAAKEAADLINQSRSRIEATVRDIKEAKAEREETLRARKDLEEFRTRLAELSRNEDELLAKDKYTRELEKVLRRKENKKRRRDKASQQGPAEQSFKSGGASLNKDTANTPASAGEINIGDIVKVDGQQAHGKVLELTKKTATISLGMLKLTINRKKLHPVSEAEEQRILQEESRIRDIQIQRQSNVIESIHNKRLSFKPELDLRGHRAAEAVEAVSYFLDEAIQLSVPQVRILHGTGSGALREAVRAYLSGVPHVKHFKDEHVDFGGAGITVVELN